MERMDDRGLIKTVYRAELEMPKRRCRYNRRLIQGLKEHVKSSRGTYVFRREKGELDTGVIVKWLYMKKDNAR